MRKSAWTGLLAVAALIAAALVGFLVPSSASADPYNPGTCGSLAVSATVVNPGEPLTVTGSGFAPGAIVHLTLYPKVTGPSGPTTKYGPVTADASGNFTLSIVMPVGAIGNQILVSDNVGAGCPADPVQFRVLGAGGSTSPGTGPPAHTGVDIALMVGIGAVLLGAGVLFTQGGRRRRAATHT